MSLVVLKFAAFAVSDAVAVWAAVSDATWLAAGTFVVTVGGVLKMLYQMRIDAAKDRSKIGPHRHREDLAQKLDAALHAPSLYDESLRLLARRGHAVPSSLLERDVSTPHTRAVALAPVFKRIYENSKDYWPEYHLCEQLVDIEESFQLWRFRHMKTVERIIGFKRGTGGSSGVAFLKKALELTFFPELIDVRTEIGV